MEILIPTPQHLFNFFIFYFHPLDNPNRFDIGVNRPKPTSLPSHVPSKTYWRDCFDPQPL